MLAYYTVKLEVKSLFWDKILRKADQYVKSSNHIFWQAAGKLLYLPWHTGRVEGDTYENQKFQTFIMYGYKTQIHSPCIAF